MDRQQKALDLFRHRCNCSQAVFTAYRQPEHLDEENAMKVATIFGAGGAASGNGLCGAVTGALMAISMRFGMGDLQSTEAKKITCEMGRKFMDDFAAAMGSCSCEAILGINIGTSENLLKAREMKLFETRCEDAVKTASQLLERLL